MVDPSILVLEAQDAHDALAPGLTPDEVRKLMTAARALRDAHVERHRHARDLFLKEQTPRRRAALERSRAALIRGLRDEVIVHLLWDTSARLHELLQVSWRRVIWRDDGSVVLRVFGKAKPGEQKAVRHVGATPETAQLLRSYLRTVFGTTTPEGFVFPGRGEQTYLSTAAAEKGFARIVDAAGIQRPRRASAKTHKHTATPKAIRACSESYAVFEANVNPKLAAHTAGHSEVVQQRHYLHTRDELAVAVARARRLHVAPDPQP